jgi:alpha-L-fucosidase
VSARSELRLHTPPAWWSDAKLGIFVHWTIASVPGWAPTHSDIGSLLAQGRRDALAETPYTEWYENSLRFPDSPASRHHREAWDDRPYGDFADLFCEGLENWDPDAWARTFARSGARYVVLVSKHHDGWCLWPSGVANPTRPGWHSKRDIVGELREAVLGAGMRFGLYYSGGLDWTFEDHPIGTLIDLLAAIPRGDYPAYAEAHVRELIDRYSPAVLWNDIAWPSSGRELWPVLAHYYRQVPDGVVNDRWMPWNAGFSAMRNDRMRSAADRVISRLTATRSSGGVVPPKPPVFDYRTPEYTAFDHVPADPWECVRGMDESFGYNRNSSAEDFLSAEQLAGTAADIVAKGGNLLLNVGPRGEDATIPDEQLALLDVLGRWAKGARPYASGPWVTQVGRTAGGADLRFWARDRSVFVAVGPGDTSPWLEIDGIGVEADAEVRGPDGEKLEFRAAAHGLSVANRLHGEWPVIEVVGGVALAG